MIRKLVSFSILTLLANASAVLAGPINFGLLQWSTDANVNLTTQPPVGGAMVYDPVTTVNGSSSNLGQSLSFSGVDASAGAFASAGLLKAGASSTAAAALGIGLSGGGFNASVGQAGSLADFTDYIIPESNTLPLGTLVHVLGTLTVSGIVDAESTSLGDSAASFSHVVLGVNEGVYSLLPGGSIDFTTALGQTSICSETPVPDEFGDPTHQDCRLGDGFLPAGGTIPFQGTTTFTADLTIGQVYALIGSLSVGTYAQADVYSQAFPTDSATSTALLDVLNTGHTFLDPMGDFFIVSESGQDYSSLVAPPPPGPQPVPEPATFALTALGLASLGARRRRRRPR